MNWEVFMKKLSILMLISWVSALLLATVSFTALAQETKRIKPDELKKMIESKANIVVVDTQPKGAYGIGHIKGAINFPWAPDIKSPGNLPYNKTLILYCDCAHEEDSTDVANQLTEKFGYRDIKILEGGWLGWQKLGYPIGKK
jgi:rhodanese-related sulfurtransferase